MCAHPAAWIYYNSWLVVIVRMPPARESFLEFQEILEVSRSTNITESSVQLAHTAKVSY